MNSRKTLLLFLKGMAMGAADSVPGVSGGTIAFITGIYDELLASIKSLDVALLRTLFQKQGLRRAWQHANGKFLLILGCGILLSLVFFANVVVGLMTQHYSYLMCFFWGLILASVWKIGRDLDRWNAVALCLFIAGALVSILLTLMPPFSGLEHPLYFFCCGALAICAMILPGISGAFILLLLGAYQPVLEALTSFELSTIAVFLAGCCCGLLGFSRLLFWLLQTRRNPTFALLLGVLAGSLFTLWPWRLPTVGAESGGAGEGLLSDVLTGEELSILLCLALLAAGFMLVVGLEYLGSKSEVKSNSSVR